MSCYERGISESKGELVAPDAIGGRTAAGNGSPRRRAAKRWSPFRRMKERRCNHSVYPSGSGTRRKWCLSVGKMAYDIPHHRARSSRRMAPACRCREYTGVRHLLPRLLNNSRAAVLRMASTADFIHVRTCAAGGPGLEQPGPDRYQDRIGSK